MSITIPTIALNDGNTAPILGLGTSANVLSGDRDRVEQAVYDAILAGYRHIDTAYMYEVEDKVGLAVKRAIDEGVVERSDMFIVTKVWCTFLRPEKVAESARLSLKKLGMDYVDLLLVHWPVALKNIPTEGGKPWVSFPKNEDGSAAEDTEVDIFNQTWPAMEKLKEEGLAKSIGVSNFNTKQIEKLLSVCKIKPTVNQVECHPLLSQEKLKAVCDKHGIVLTAYSPFGGSPKARDGVLIPHEVKLSLWENETIKKLADKYGKTVGQILLKYHVQRGIIVISKSVTKTRIIENTDIFDFELTPEELSSLLALNQGLRSIYPEGLSTCINFPLDEE